MSIAPNFARRPGLTGSAAILICCLAVLPATLPEASAQSGSSISEAEAEKLLKSLETFADEVKEKKYGRNRELIEKLEAASKSETKAYELYLECKKKTDFTDLGKRQSEFRDWKNRNEKRIRTRSYTTALRLQIEFLAITLRAAASEKLDAEVPRLENFLAGMAASFETMEDVTYKMKEDILRSDFAKAAELTRSFKPRKGWVSQPADVDGIYRQVLLPFYRTKQSKALIASAWNTRIQLLSKIAAAGDEAAISDFKSNDLPTLHWQRECELLAHGDEGTHIKKMWDLIRANSTHGNSDDWITTLKSILSAKAEGKPFPPLPFEPEPDKKSASSAVEARPATPAPSRRTRGNFR